MIKIGLTGGIASGKSTVSGMLKALDIPVIDADLAAKQVMEPGEAAYQKTVEAFGEEILFPDQTIDRKKLGNLIFNDEAKRKELNGIVHPEVRRHMKRELERLEENGTHAAVLDIPLLIESRLTSWVDYVLVVYVGEEVQLSRLMERDQAGDEDARSRINSQMRLEEKSAYADAVINNEGTKEETQSQLLDILKEWNVLPSNKQ